MKRGASKKLKSSLDKRLFMDYLGPWKLEEGDGRIKLYEGGKLVFDVADIPDVHPVVDRLLPALVNEQQLIRRLWGMIERPAAARAKKPDTIRKIVLEAAANLPSESSGSNVGLVARVRRAAIKEIVRRRKADPNGLNPETPKRADVTERYVRQVLSRAPPQDAEQ